MRFCGETAEGRKRGADRRRSLMARRRVIFIRARILALGADLPRVGGEGVNDGFSENRVPPKKSAVPCGDGQRNEARQQEAGLTDTLRLEAGAWGDVQRNDARQQDAGASESLVLEGATFSLPRSIPGGRRRRPRRRRHRGAAGERVAWSRQLREFHWRARE